MNVLKSKLSGYYFKDFGVWTATPVDASTFTDEWSARDFVRRHHIGDVQIVEHEVSTLELEAAV